MQQELQARQFKRSQDFVARKIAGEIVLIPLQRHLENVNSIYSLNEVGALVWDALDGKRSVSELREMLFETFEVNPAQLDQDLTTLLTQLEEIKAIHCE